MRLLSVGLLALAAVALSAPRATASLRFFDTDRLDEGRAHKLPLPFRKGGSYMVVAIASKGGIDFDVRVSGPDGTELIASSSTDTNTDWVRFTAPVEGTYEVKITAYKGSGWYELVVLDTDSY
jgi:hypothetical protein